MLSSSPEAVAAMRVLRHACLSYAGLTMCHTAHTEAETDAGEVREHSECEHELMEALIAVAAAGHHFVHVVEAANN